MTLTICGDRHPEHPVTCALREDPTEHEFHTGYADGIGPVEWDNPDYRPPVRIGGGSSKKEMDALAKTAEPEARVQDSPAMGEVAVPPEESVIQRRFEVFHAENPHVYGRIVELARDMRSRGHQRLAIGMFWEIIRWEGLMQVRDPSQQTYKLNDHYRSRYARLIMSSESDLEGFFEVRQLRS